MALLGEVGSIAMVILILYGLTSKSLVKTIILLMLLEDIITEQVLETNGQSMGL